jgi:CIC family chloride channel protein
MPSKPMAALARASRRFGFGQDWTLITLGAVVGTLTGLAAVAFNFAVEATKERVFALPTWALLAAPIVGMGLSGVLVHALASEAKGHGVPQVLRALISRGGVITGRTGLVKAVASILTVGSGGSAGTEGPIVQIGATVGSVCGQRLRVSREQMGVLVGCGAAAGISSIFNAPIAGVFFVLEVLLRDFSIRTFSPIVIASVFSNVVTQSILGEDEAIFAVSEGVRRSGFLPGEIPSYLVLGAAGGLLSVLFIRALHAGESMFEHMRAPALLRPVAGAALLGILGAIYLLVARQAGAVGESARVPAFFANGYETIRHLLEPASYTGRDGLPTTLTLLAALLVFKLAGTIVTLGSGGSGGIFAPSLFLGAAAGAALGQGLALAGWLPDGSTPAWYALLGMATVVAGTMHAPLTAILMLFELTRNTGVVLPAMLATILATAIAQVLERDSIYTFGLRRAGLVVGSARDLTLLRRIPVTSVEPTPLPPEPVYPSDPLAKLVAMHAVHRVPDFPVVDETGRYIGMVVGADMRSALIDREAIPLLLVAEIMRTDLPAILPDEHLDSVMDKFAAHDVASLCLLDDAPGARPAALITRGKVLSRYRAALEGS